MDTKKLFKNFHKKDQVEIAKLVHSFIVGDFFIIHPELKSKVSILITGSVASKHYDNKSDIDLTIIFPTEKTWKEYKFKLLGEFKNEYLEPLKKPLELHGKNITFLKRINEDLGSWKNDWMLREFADAIIIHDPKDQFGKIKEKYDWYPKDIYHEKMNWLFAELSFLLFDRYKNAMDRNSFYFTEIIKLKILRLLLSSLIMANKEYPTYDKHSYECVSRNLKYSELMKLIDNIALEKNAKITFKLFMNLRKKIEKLLVSEKLIPKESDRYWIGLRPAYKVSTEE